MRDIRYFKVIAEHKNLGRAATALGVSATALSKSLRRLERDYGVTLIRRTAKGVELMEVGNALLALSEKIELLIKDFKREASTLRDGSAGHITAGATAGLSEQFIAQAYGTLFQKTPNISLKTLVLDGGPLIEGVQSGQIDFSVQTLPSTLPSELAGELLFSDKRGVYVATDHRLAGRTPVLLSELAKEPWASDITGAANWSVLSQIFVANGLNPPRLVLESNSMDIRLSVIESSNVVMYTSNVFMQKAKRRYRIVQLKVDGVSSERQIGMIYRKSGYQSPAGQSLMEILRSQSKQNIYRKR